MSSIAVKNRRLLAQMLSTREVAEKSIFNPFHLKTYKQHFYNSNKLFSQTPKSIQKHKIKLKKSLSISIYFFRNMKT